MKTIVLKQNATFKNPDIGYVRAVMAEVSGKWIPIADAVSQFPNTGNILIFNAYHSEIDKRYLKEELFFLDCNVNPGHNDSQASSCKYSASGNAADEPQRHQLCPVLNKPFDPARPIILSVDDQPYNYIFLRDGEFIYGPFWHTNETEADNDDKLRIRLKADNAVELEISADYENCIFQIPVADAKLLEANGQYYVLDVRELLSEDRRLRHPIYYGAPTELMEWARRKVGGAWSLDIRHLRQIGQYLDDLNPDGKLEVLKLDRLRHLMRGNEEWISQKLPAFARQFLTDTDEGQEFLNDYLRNNEAEIYSRQKDDWQRLHAEIRKLNDELRRRKAPGDASLVPLEAPTFLRPVLPTPGIYVAEVRQWLEDAGRPMDFNDTANYLITLQQSYLTVMAGLPGVGKTSLVLRLAGAMGLTNRTLTVPVGRGWTSVADLAGYYNPFTEQFQAARTGMYEALKQLDAEQERADDLPYLVLLDEANLSPLEHYWSDFMRLSDPESEPVLTLAAGNQNAHFRLGRGLRFVATINYDHTTEVLSPRLLDRAAVIRLQVARDLLEPNFSEPPEPLPLLTSGQAQALFGETSEPFTADEAALFRQLREILENEEPAFGQPIVISPRKQRAVLAYCGRGRTILEGESAFTALDFAVSQHVLPLVNGRGEAFGRRLRKLLELIDRPLPRSARLLTRLLTVGADSYQVYRFFS